MKVALSEIRENLQGTNSGGNAAENQINDLEHKEGKSIQSEEQEDKRLKKKKKNPNPRLGLGTPGTSLNIPTLES